MRLYVNGEEREFAELEAETPLSRLVDVLQMKADRIAIERNGEIVPRSQWPQTPLSAGDHLEIVQFVGGGR
ncbi:MAG: sulfur carrier protein ThiS [Acidobacteriaceae bacterium]